MSAQPQITGWSKERVFWAVGLLLAVLLAIFVSLNVAVGPSEEIKGKIISIGMQTATIYELPYPLITVETSSGDILTIEVTEKMNISKGDSVILLKSNKLLTPGSEYKLLKVVASDT